MKIYKVSKIGPLYSKSSEIDVSDSNIHARTHSPFISPICPTTHIIIVFAINRQMRASYCHFRCSIFSFFFFLPSAYYTFPPNVSLALTLL